MIELLDLSGNVQPTMKFLTCDHHGNLFFFYFSRYDDSFSKFPLERDSRTLFWGQERQKKGVKAFVKRRPSSFPLTAKRSPGAVLKKGVLGRPMAPTKKKLSV